MDKSHPTPIHAGAVAAVASLLDGERLLSLAVNGLDGWPRVTTIGYVNEGLNLYVVVSRTSVKLAAIQADSRVSIAVHSEALQGDAVGVSMTARATEVTDPACIERINRMVSERYSGLHVFGPESDTIAVLHLRPEIVSPVSVIRGRSHTQSFSVGAGDSGKTPIHGSGSDLDQGGRAL